MTRSVNKTLKLTAKKTTNLLMCVLEHERAKRGVMSQEKKMINLFGTTKGKSEGVCNMDRGTDKTTDVRTSCQESTHTCCHGGAVVKRPTHHCVVVLGHGGQEVTFYSGKAHKEEALSCTTIAGDDLVP